jgi:hypothetical protein
MHKEQRQEKLVPMTTTPTTLEISMVEDVDAIIVSFIFFFFLLFLFFFVPCTLLTTPTVFVAFPHHQPRFTILVGQATMLMMSFSSTLALERAPTSSITFMASAS